MSPDKMHDEDETDGLGHSDAESRGSISRLKKVKSKIAARTIHAVANKVSQIIDKSHEEDKSVANTIDDSAFHPGPVNQPFEADKSSLSKTKAAVRSTAAALKNPKKVVRAKAKKLAAGKISAAHKPFSLPKDSDDLIDAFENIQDDSSVSVDSDISNGSPHNVAKQNGTQRSKKARLKKLEDQRQSLQVAWATKRVVRVRAVSNQSRVAYPVTKDFYSRKADNNVSFDVLPWLGHLALWYTQNFTSQYVDDFEALPFDLDSLRVHTERLIMATAPWQVWLMDVRSIYRWEDPLRTGRWLVLWFLVWYFEYVASFLWASAIYYTIRNKLYPSSMRHLKASMLRTKSREIATFDLGEFIDSHGRDDWVDPLIDQLGPFVQLQVSDIANAFEILANFYSWKSPYYTMATLCMLASSLAVALLTELRYGMKIFWLLVGSAFFLCWPIATLYPRYRILVSPYRWMLWNIPTHSEWSFQYLRDHCDESRRRMMDEKQQEQTYSPTQQQYNGRISYSSNTETDTRLSDSDSDYHSASSQNSFIQHTKFLSYRSIWKGLPGRLSIRPHDLEFIRSIKHKQLWSIPYTAILELRKYKRGQAACVEKKSRSKHKGADELLEIETTDGHVYNLDLGERRDEVFNYILGFSGLKWQSLHSS